MRLREARLTAPGADTPMKTSAPDSAPEREPRRRSRLVCFASHSFIGLMFAWRPS